MSSTVTSYFREIEKSVSPVPTICLLPPLIGLLDGSDIVSEVVPESDFIISFYQAKDGEEALAKLKNLSNIDVLITDISMPKLYMD